MLDVLLWLCIGIAVQSVIIAWGGSPATSWANKAPGIARRRRTMPSTSKAFAQSV